MSDGKARTGALEQVAAKASHLVQMWSEADAASRSFLVLDIATALRQLDAAEAGMELLSCGRCYRENGEEVHPHPECKETS